MMMEKEMRKKSFVARAVLFEKLAVPSRAFHFQILTLELLKRLTVKLELRRD